MNIYKNWAYFGSQAYMCFRHNLVIFIIYEVHIFISIFKDAKSKTPYSRIVYKMCMINDRTHTHIPFL